MQQIADALVPLTSHALQAHRELAALSGANELLRPVGWLKVYETEAGFAAESTAFALPPPAPKP